MCGENTRPKHAHTTELGSSPRVRGKQDEGTFQPRRAGLIPACAGKTPSPPETFSRPPAHPRVCGENVYHRAFSQKNGGSSPRVRGKLIHACQRPADLGLIPACAGKTCTLCQVGARGWAHPRVCGENVFICTRFLHSRGSSPRVRGKRTVGSSAQRRIGLIPACAGKTKQARKRRANRPAHPRVCGENLGAPPPMPPKVGSSPRVRGKLALNLFGLGPFRLIPACAGKTLGLRRTSLARWAHPRVCGENPPPKSSLM